VQKAQGEFSRLVDLHIFGVFISRIHSHPGFAYVSNQELRSMNGPNTNSIAWLLILTVAATGCHPTQPFYFHEDGDLSHYIDHATEIAHPDVERASLAEVTQAAPPLSVADPEFDNFLDVSLEECVGAALHNSSIIRNTAAITQLGFADGLLNRLAASSTVYDSAILEAGTAFGPRQVNSNTGSLFLSEVSGRATSQGVEDALSEFDAQFYTKLAYGTTDRPRNVQPNNQFNPQQFTQRGSGAQANSFLATLSKKTAGGGVFSLRNRTTYTSNNIPIGVGRALPSDWVTEMEVEAQYPLLRNRGTMINRIPVILARINTDISLADFEAAIRNLVLDVENAYWDLHLTYHSLETARIGRDSALVTWQVVSAKAAKGVEGAQRESQVLEQYHFFSAQLENSQSALFDAESRLRWLMGLTTTDNRVFRPTDDPTKAEVTFDWETVKQESLYRSPELRQQKWRIKSAELEVLAARNQMLPKLDASLLYRWVGIGDDLVNADRNGLNFPSVGSTAVDELLEGNYQEAYFQLDFQPHRFGARRPRANLRGAELRLARARKLLDEMELQQVHLVSGAWRRIRLQYSQTTWQFNRWMDSHREVESSHALFSGGQLPLDQVLDAHRRRADSQTAFYQALTEYNKSIAQLHFYRGTLLDFNSIHLAEGPWPNKAYDDAHEKARERDASYFLDYGSTRPSVVSRGPVDGSHNGGQVIDGSIIDGTMYDGQIIDGQIIDGQIIDDTIIDGRVQNPAVGTGVIDEYYIEEMIPGQNGPRYIEETQQIHRGPTRAAPKAPEPEKTPVGRRPEGNPGLDAPIRAQAPANSRRQVVRTVSEQRPTTDDANPLRNANYVEPALR
jgi:outer membrane protein TolC